jgi:hypothetical protein
MSKSDLKETLFILMAAPLTAQNYDRVGIPYLKSRFRIIVLDCARLMNYSDVPGVDLKAIDIELHKVPDFYTLEALILRYKPQLALDFIGQSTKNIKFAQVLKKNGVKLFIERTGPLPIEQSLDPALFNHGVSASQQESCSLDSMRACISRLLNQLLVTICGWGLRIWNKSKYEIFLFRFKRHAPAGALLAGDASLDRVTAQADHILWIGSNDYHTYTTNYNQLNEFPTGLKGELYILFIDDCIAQANDWHLLGIQPPVSPNSYFKEMMKAFDSLENIFGMRIVIAGHPNAKNDVNYSTNFGGREVYFGITAQLVHNSYLCLIHCSTATSFAVLANKPLISLISDELLSNSYGNKIRLMSNLLGTTLISISLPIHDLAQNNILDVDYRKYLSYKRNFLYGSKCVEIKPWQEFLTYQSDKVDGK